MFFGNNCKQSISKIKLFLFVEKSVVICHCKQLKKKLCYCLFFSRIAEKAHFLVNTFHKPQKSAVEVLQFRGIWKESGKEKYALRCEFCYDYNSTFRHFQRLFIWTVNNTLSLKSFNWSLVRCSSDYNGKKWTFIECRAMQRNFDDQNTSFEFKN
jgi:hypothetical protein